MHNPPDDTGAARLIEVFGLSIGRGHPIALGPVARFATDTLARALSSFDGLIARPHHAILGADIDANLTALDEDDIPVDRVRFILREALPIDGALRRLTRAQGGTIAMTGRLGLDRDNLALALNIWDVERAALLWCTTLAARAEDLPSVLGRAASDAAWSLQAKGAESKGQAQAQAAASVGTRSRRAFEAMANATDQIRKAEVEGKPAPPGQLVRVLVGALEQDPEYDAPRLLLTEIAVAQLQNRDPAFAKALMQALMRLTDERLIYDLLRFEALISMDRTESARDLLDKLDARYPSHKSLGKARARLRA